MTNMSLITIPKPEVLEELGVGQSLLEDLALRILYLEGELSLNRLAEKMGLKLAIV